MLIDIPAEVLCLGTCERLSVDAAFSQDFFRRSRLHVKLCRTLQRVIDIAKLEPAAIPGSQRFSPRISKRPAITGVNATLMQVATKHVVVVGYDRAIERICYRKLISL